MGLERALEDPRIQARTYYRVVKKDDMVDSG